MAESPYRITAYIPVENETEYKTREEAEKELKHMELLQPENIYGITMVGEHSKEQESPPAYEKTRKIGYFHNGSKEFPKILLQGEYLREAGFEVGEHYKIRVSYGKVEVEKV